jgi:Flp pilus assembly protein protease CpaA
MLELFLIILAFIWLIFAVVSDLRTREIPNWLNFSLIIFALSGRLFYSVFSGPDWSFFIQGVFGFAVFFAIANLLYYGRFFAGGDAKLLMALGPILPFGTSLLSNVSLFLSFLSLFFIVGAAYGFVMVLYLSFKDTQKLKKSFLRGIKKNRKSFFIFMGIGLTFMLAGLAEELLFILGVLIFLLPYLFFYTKAIDNTSLVKRINAQALTEGDWLYKDLRVGKNIIKARWEGLSKREIALIRRKCKFVLIKRGVEFSPVFLISFVFFVYFYLNGMTNLWNSLW